MRCHLLTGLTGGANGRPGEGGRNHPREYPEKPSVVSFLGEDGPGPSTLRGDGPGPSTLGPTNLTRGRPSPLTDVVDVVEVAPRSGRPGSVLWTPRERKDVEDALQTRVLG